MVAVAALGTAGCGRTGPSDLGPPAILARAADEADKVDTAHFSLEQRNGSLQLASGVRMANADGDVRRPDQLQMRYTMLLGGGLSAEAHLIAMGDEQFVTNPFTGQWLASKSTHAAPRFLDKERGVSHLLRTLGNAQRLSDERLDAVPTWHFVGNLSTSAFADMMNSQPVTDVVPGEIWVGAEDFLPRQLWLEGPIGVGDSEATVRILKFSNFNQYVVIEPPPT